MHGLGRGRELGGDLDVPDGSDRSEGSAASDRPFELLAAVLRDGPEVGVHVVASCDSLAQFDTRLGRPSLSEFGVCVVTAMDEQDSTTLLDSPYASTLRSGHALLADEERGKLVKFRPYVLPPRGWSP